MLQRVRRKGKIFLLPWKMKCHWAHHSSSAEGLWQGVWAVWETGSDWKLQNLAPLAAARASKSSGGDIQELYPNPPHVRYHMCFLNNCFMGNANQKTLILFCASMTAPFGPCCCHEHSFCPHALVQQCGSPTSWSLLVHEESGDPTDTSLLPSPGWLQQYTARVEGLCFGDGQQAILSWVC